MGSIISGIFGGGDKSADQEQQLAQMRHSAEGLQQYRQEAMGARSNALGQMLKAYQPMQNMLETMYGGRNKPAPVGASPMANPPAGAAPYAPDGPTYKGPRWDPTFGEHVNLDPSIINGGK